MLIEIQTGRSFIEQVSQRAYIDGFPTLDNPKTPGTVDFHLWELGQLRMEYSDPILADERSLDEDIQLEGRIFDEENHIAAMAKNIGHNLASIDMIAERLRSPIPSWSGNCYGIASEIVDAGLIEGKAVFGHYHGPVDQQSPFAGRGIVQHGWIERPDGVIVDPTRWVFENEVPYLHVDGNLDGDYDRGGQMFLAAKLSNPPGYDPASKTVELPANETADRWIRRNLGTDPATITREQAFWLANVPVDLLGPAAPDIHDALSDAGIGSLIPIDMWEMSRERAPKTRDKPTPAMATLS